MESKYMEFVELLTTRKTELWEVRSKASSVKIGDLLGYIKWYSPWRRYCFHPCANTVFSIGCQDDISAKIRQLMDERKAKREGFSAEGHEPTDFY